MPRLTAEDKELILADYHTGHYTQRELAKKYNTSHVTVGKITKGQEPKHKDKVTTQIAIATELSQESYQEVKAVETIVTEKTRHLQLINDNATKLARKLAVMADPIDTPNDMKTLAEANDKLAVTLKVADRHAPKIDVTQQQAQSTTTVVKIEEDIVGD